MNLTFQVLCDTVLYSNRLSPPDTSTTERGFLFGFFTSFFLELLAIALCSSPVVYWTPSDLARGLIFWWHIFLLFHTIHGVLEGRILKWVAISSSSGLCFVRTLHYDLSIWGGRGLHGMAHSFTELQKPLCTTRLLSRQRLVHFISIIIT